VEAETDVLSLGAWVGEILAEERRREVALVDEREIGAEWASDGYVQGRYKTGSIHQSGTRIHRNLWLLPGRRGDSDLCKGSSSAYLGEVRQEFE